MQNGKRNVWRKISVSLLTVTVLGGAVQFALSEPAAAVSGTTPIRVGLMINSGSIQTATDTVTLQGRAGVGVGFYHADKFSELFNSSSSVKASLDNYYILVGEYDTLNEAQQAADTIDQKGLSWDIYAESTGGQVKYQVICGYQETWAQAEAAQSRVGGTIKGYLRLTTGTVGDIAAAKARAEQLRGQGVPAYPTVRKNGEWEVWVGNEASEEALAALNAKLGGGYGRANYQPADYIMIKPGLFGTQQVPHAIISSTKEEIAIVPKGTPAVTKVMEKGNREYRGSILIQGYQEKPNVINYIGLDQYLYGVVPHEMSTGWPLEALKAQSVAARTYAARKVGSNKWGVADISDYTYDQAYSGFSREAEDTNRAVDETKGQVLTTQGGKMIEALYSSNNGGANGDVEEMWGSKGFDYLKAVNGPFDHVAAANEPLYYRVQTADGQIGWIKAAGVDKSGKNGAGLETGKTKGGQPLRVIPEASAQVLQTPAAGTRVVILAEEKEYNPFNWQRGPYSPTEMQNMLNNTVGGYNSPIYDLRVTKWGQGERAMEITANGKRVDADKPDNFRWVFDNLWSTKFKIDQQGTYTVLGANGQKSEYPNAQLDGQALHVVTASGAATTAINGDNEQFVVLGAGGQSRVAAKSQQYVISGNGYGHGLGMSQWGANGMAKNGYTYDRILAHYYVGTVLTPKQ